MNQNSIKQKFSDIGVHVQFRELNQLHSRSRFRRTETSMPIRIDVETTKKGKEYFVIDYRNDRSFELIVLDTQPKLKHLLLMMKYNDQQDGNTKSFELVKSKFLCGFDERHYFTCAIPESARVSTVYQAYDALKPKEVSHSEYKQNIKSKDQYRRKNKAFVRQGEWFFIPAPNVSPEALDLIRKNEPISRGNGSKSHIVDFAFSVGGDLVYVNNRFARNGVSEKEMKKIKKREADAGRSSIHFTPRYINPDMYVKGRVCHPDHKTIELLCWHKVVMNTEHKAKAAPAIVFLD